MFLYASSLEAPTVLQEYGALPITVSFPTMNRLILNRTYAGFDGALTLFEETINTFVGHGKGGYMHVSSIISWDQNSGHKGKIRHLLLSQSPDCSS